MGRRSAFWMPIVLSLAGSFVTSMAIPAAEPPAASRPPNGLFLLTDDQRPDTIGALGNPLIHTPHLDGLVRRGTAFTRAVSPNPLCVPSRAEILTGCSGFRNGILPERSSRPSCAPGNNWSAIRYVELQYATAVKAYSCATRTRSSMATHSWTVCCPPARGPWVMAGTRPSAQKLLPSSTNGLGPRGNS